MANIIKPKRSNTAAKVPTTTDLTSGELGVNMADKKVYINNGTAVVQVGAGNLSGLGDTAISSPTNGQSLIYNGTAWVNQAGSGTGDVVGPASATDNAITRFDGTTGKTIQNSAATLDDNGNFAGVNGLTFNTSPTSPPTAAGAMAWDNGDGTPYVVLNANTSLQLGQENIARVYNGTGSTIAKGSVVAVSGAQGQRPSVVLADADSEALSAPTLGIATEAIANGAEGFVCTFGLVRGLNTSAFTAGAPIYLSSTAGAFTATKPVAPQHIVALGWVISVNASSGEVFVNINNGWELDELHNVLITSAASGNTLIYDAAAGVWENANLTAGTGISVTGGAGSITIANTGVTSVTGTAPVSSSGGATPAISLASGYGDTQNPYASKTANTFLAAPNGTAGVPTFRAIVAADIPTLNQNTTGTASNVTGTVAIANGGTGATTAASARTNLGATTVGGNLFTLTNPSAVTFPRFNADNTVSALDAATFRTAIGAGTSSTTGTVTSVSGTGTVSGLSLSGTVTTSGNITLGGTLSVTPSNFASQTANTVLAAPNGTAGTPTFRALVAADIPTLNQNTTGSAATLTTGRTISMTGDVTYTSGSFNGSANVTGTATLANSGVTAGTYNNVTVNAKGLITGGSNAAYLTQAFPSGTTMIFAQTAAPTGWTKQVTHNDKALRVVSGTASSGGSVAFSSAFTSQAVNGSVGSTTLSTSQMPSHVHNYQVAYYLGGGSVGVNGDNLAGASARYNSTPQTFNAMPAQDTAGNGSNGSHNHSFTGTAINLAVQYVDVILASKD